MNQLKVGDDVLVPYKRIRLHEINDEPHLATIGHASKSNADWRFLVDLKNAGREAAKRWLAQSLGDVGKSYKRNGCKL